MGQILDQVVVTMPCDAAPRTITTSSTIDPTNRGIIRLTAAGGAQNEYVPNPSFETDLSGWTAAANSTISRATGSFVSGLTVIPLHYEAGVASMKLSAIDQTGASGLTFGASQAAYAVTPGLRYRLGIVSLAPIVGNTLNVTFSWYTSGGALISSVTFGLGGGAPWTGFPQVVTAPGNAASAAMSLSLNLLATNLDQSQYIDQVRLTSAPIITDLRMAAGNDKNRVAVIANESNYDLFFAARNTSLVGDGNAGQATAGVYGDIPAQTMREFTWNGAYWFGHA